MNLNDSEKLKIIRSIPDEDTLRTDVVIPILRNMNVYMEVNETHGANEKGKDIVTVHQNHLGFLEYTAFILKNTDITCATSSKEKECFSIVIAQIQSTIASGFDCLKQHRNVPFTQIIVLSSKNISTTARTELLNAAKRFNFYNLQFIQDQDLMCWINKYLPEFYTVRSGSIATYIGKLKEMCERLEELRNISRYRGEIKKVLDVFISPILYRIHKKKLDDSYKAETVYSNLRELLFRRRNIWIEAPAGGGKSTLIRAEIQKLISFNVKGQKPNIPIYIRAIDIIGQNISDLRSAVENHIKKEFNCSDFDIATLKISSNVFLFIDGLDEVTDLGNKLKLVEKITEFSKNNHDIKVIVSSRPTNDLGKLDIELFDKWTIMPFNNKQIKEFIFKWFSSTSGHDKLLEAIKDHELLEKLPTTPLVLTLLAILFESDTQTEVPSNLSELYQMFIDVLVGKWRLDRRIDTFFQANILEYILQQLAFQLQEEKKYSVGNNNFNKLILDANTILGIKTDIELLKKELLDTNIIIQNEKDEYEFRHLSFQEFLAAKWLLRESQNSVAVALDERFPDDWWSHVVYYFCGLQKSNSKLLIEISKVIQKTELRECIRSIWNYGYLIQSSYLTPASLREQLVVEQLILYGNKVKVL